MIVAKIPRPMTPSHSARILLCSVAVACAFSLPKASAQLDPDLLAWEPFNYPTTPSASAPDLNGDGNVDLWGLNGGFGFSGGWIEYGASEGSYPLDYIQPFSLGVPASSAGLMTAGGSLRSYMTLASAGTYLSRTFASPIATTDGTTLWISLLVQKERTHSNAGTIGDDENFKFALHGSDRQLVWFGDARDYHQSPQNYFLEGDRALGFADQGPVVGVTDLLVVKLSFLANSPNTMELFLNPTPGIVPTSPNVAIELPTEFSEVRGFDIQMESPLYRTQWSLDEIRIGKTYASVTPAVPEPSSVLLAGFGLGAAGFTRLRRNRAA